MEQYEEQEHEVYGGEIPDEEGEVDADMSGGAEDYEGNEHDLEHDPNSNSKVTPLFLDFLFFFFKFSFSWAFCLIKSAFY